MNEHLIETRQLRHLLMLAKHRNFRKAADALFITQPALTKSIRNLESQLDVTLFDRKSQSVDPTPHCEVLLEHARRVIRELEDARHSLDAMTSELQGQLRVGSGPVIVLGRVSQAISRLLAAHPQLSVKITIESWNNLSDLLREGRLHLFVADVEELLDQPDLEIIELGKVRSVYACRPDHPLAGSGGILPENLLDYPLAVPSLPRRFIQWLRANAPRGIDPEAYVDRVCRVNCESMTVLRRIARDTNLITGGPISMFEPAFASGELVELAFEGFSDIEVSPGIAFLRNTTLPPVANALIRELQADLGKPLF